MECYKIDKIDFNLSEIGKTRKYFNAIKSSDHFKVKVNSKSYTIMPGGLIKDYYDLYHNFNKQHKEQKLTFEKLMDYNVKENATKFRFLFPTDLPVKDAYKKVLSAVAVN